ncbi:MAG: hypothetical protein PHX54_07155, partial [Lentimicrobiaceae bacterium]|nr:hypothetical protein [Lentimicrobiaceae bacterium]
TTRKFKKFDVYAGIENLTNFVQHHPIMNYDQPFESGFDAGVMWGPLLGRMIYGGVRYSIK